VPLNFSGQQIKTETGTNFEAFDHQKRVVVKASDEALQDYGENSVRLKASDKYDEGRVETDGSVRVTTSDF